MFAGFALKSRPSVCNAYTGDQPDTEHSSTNRTQKAEGYQQTVGALCMVSLKQGALENLSNQVKQRVASGGRDFLFALLLSIAS